MTRYASFLPGLRANWTPNRHAVRGSCPTLRQCAPGAYEGVEQAHDQHGNHPREGADEVTNRIDLVRLGPMGELPPGLPSIGTLLEGIHVAQTHSTRHLASGQRPGVGRGAPAVALVSGMTPTSVVPIDGTDSHGSEGESHGREGGTTGNDGA